MNKGIILLLVFAFSAMLNANNLTEYKASNGVIYNIGDTIELGIGSKPLGSFEYVRLISPEKKNTNYSGVGKVWAGLKLVIKKISNNGEVVFQIDSSIWIQIENALANGEVKGGGMTSDQALTQLKKEKDKLDLNIITQDEYDKKKAELVKYIK